MYTSLLTLAQRKSCGKRVTSCLEISWNRACLNSTVQFARTANHVLRICQSKTFNYKQKVWWIRETKNQVALSLESQRQVITWTTVTWNHMSSWRVLVSAPSKAFIQKLKILNVGGKYNSTRSQNIVPKCKDPPRVIMGMCRKLQIWIITCKVKEVEVSKDAWRNRENRMHLVDVSIQIWDRTMIVYSMLPRYTSLDVASFYHIPILCGSPK